jgi:hypothetical protein
VSNRALNAQLAGLQLGIERFDNPVLYGAIVPRDTTLGKYFTYTKGLRIAMVVDGQVVTTIRVNKDSLALIWLPITSGLPNALTFMYSEVINFPYRGDAAVLWGGWQAIKE